MSHVPAARPPPPVEGLVVSVLADTPRRAARSAMRRQPPSWDSPTVPRDTLRVLVSSTVSGMLVSAISTPFDVVKNYWIYNPRYTQQRTAIGARHVASMLYREGGLRLFYAGFGATCMTLVPANIVFFQCYERLRATRHLAIAGVEARVAAVLLTAPCEYFRTALQANAGTTFRQLIRTVGIRHILQVSGRGLCATVLRDVPFSALYWPLNENGKAWLLGASRRENGAQRGRFYENVACPFIAGATSAAVASTITHPLDVVKTTIQGAYREPFPSRPVSLTMGQLGLRLTGAQIWRRSGWRGFFVGLGPRLAKIVPSCALILATYDFSKTLVPTTPPTKNKSISL